MKTILFLLISVICAIPILRKAVTLVQDNFSLFKIQPLTPGHISGSVRRHGVEISGARISLIPLKEISRLGRIYRRSTITDANGCFALSKLLPGTYEVVVSIASHQAEHPSKGGFSAAKITLREAGQKEIDIDLEPGQEETT